MSLIMSDNKHRKTSNNNLSSNTKFPRLSFIHKVPFSSTTKANNTDEMSKSNTENPPTNLKPESRVVELPSSHTSKVPHSNHKHIPKYVKKQAKISDQDLAILSVGIGVFIFILFFWLMVAGFGWEFVRKWWEGGYYWKFKNSDDKIQTTDSPNVYTSESVTEEDSISNFFRRTGTPGDPEKGISDDYDWSEYSTEPS